MPKKSDCLSEFRNRKLFNLDLRGRLLGMSKPTLMGVLNVTPDSFSDAGLYLKPKAALSRARILEKTGADILDIGGQSSRPGSHAVSTAVEIARVIPVLKMLKREIKIPISVDTHREDVAAAALDAGATIINDIRALRGNANLARRIARYEAGVVLMHMRGTPQTMQKNTRYPKGVVKDVFDFLRSAREFALNAGIREDRIILDPGFGFGKSTQQNIELLKNIPIFLSLGSPLLVGVSRKRFIGEISAEPMASKRVIGTLAASVEAFHQGAQIFRVHDVYEHRVFFNALNAMTNQQRRS